MYVTWIIFCSISKDNYYWWNVDDRRLDLPPLKRDGFQVFLVCWYRSLVQLGSVQSKAISFRWNTDLSGKDYSCVLHLAECNSRTIGRHGFPTEHGYMLRHFSTFDSPFSINLCPIDTTFLKIGLLDWDWHPNDNWTLRTAPFNCPRDSYTTSQSKKLKNFFYQMVGHSNVCHQTLPEIVFQIRWKI